MSLVEGGGGVESERGFQLEKEMLRFDVVRLKIAISPGDGDGLDDVSAVKSGDFAARWRRP